ncbi:helix-turn-helix transcriptional regulator [Brevibacillus massiliensis]|uniref:helix-turn-helix transcriptional regulator n=1 Tax=Brevibacillus massiliensis TaxID=1118054 RepID=UPI0003113D36|nr:helix-turn-helix transcriptional regulator [Brevibacillus massiliensis]
MAVKNRLKEIRYDHRMNQMQFAEYLGLAQQQYNRYENQVRQPTLEIALLISEKIGRPVNEIFYIE